MYYFRFEFEKCVVFGDGFFAVQDWLFGCDSICCCFVISFNECSFFYLGWSSCVNCVCVWGGGIVICLGFSLDGNWMGVYYLNAFPNVAVYTKLHVLHFWLFTWEVTTLVVGLL